MRRTFIIFLTALACAAIGTATALAQNVHLKGGANAEPAFTDHGLFLSAAGELVGLGGGDVRDREPDGGLREPGQR
jgi:hypothetical protein